MSAENPTEKSTNGVYQFRCAYPIPSYLFALAVGDLRCRSLSPRSSVYAEPAVVSQAAWELAELEGMIKAAGTLFGPYRWKRCDLIVMPFSFPLGGMENPQLVFVTPALLAGDRSLTSLVAHELSHAWSGNMVTNATWEDFWLNEGFSVYAEHRVMEELYGKEYDDMLAMLSFRSLTKAIAVLPARDTWLHLDLGKRHPDDCFTEIPYEKGYFFLRMIEENVGRELWDRFVQEYFDTFAFQSITSSAFLAFLRERLTGGDVELDRKLGLEDWIYGPGLPKNCPKVRSVQLEQVDAANEQFENGSPAAELNTDMWTTHHWLYFLSNLTVPLAREVIEDLNQTFALSKTKNAEMMYRWLLLCIASRYECADPALTAFLLRHGRMKYIRGLYQELVKTEEGKKQAQRIYRLARPRYHSAIVRFVDEMLVA